MKYPERQYKIQDIPLATTKGCGKEMEGGYWCSYHVYWQGGIVHIACANDKICEATHLLRREP